MKFPESNQNMDTQTPPLYVVTDEDVGDVSCMERLIDIVLGSGHKIGRILGDTTYDKKDFRNKYRGVGKYKDRGAGSRKRNLMITEIYWIVKSFNLYKGSRRARAC